MLPAESTDCGCSGTADLQMHDTLALLGLDIITCSNGVKAVALLKRC